MMISGGFIKSIDGTWISLNSIDLFEIEEINNLHRIISYNNNTRNSYNFGNFPSKERAQYELDNALQHYSHWTGQNG